MARKKVAVNISLRYEGENVKLRTYGYPYLYKRENSSFTLDLVIHRAVLFTTKNPKQTPEGFIVKPVGWVVTEPVTGHIVAKTIEGTLTMARTNADNKLNAIPTSTIVDSILRFSAREEEDKLLFEAYKMPYSGEWSVRRI